MLTYHISKSRSYLVGVAVNESNLLDSMGSMFESQSDMSL